jgi:hypothetical protein
MPRGERVADEVARAFLPVVGAVAPAEGAQAHSIL